ncbi:hypothetical protein ACOME3_008661 [Neoechinorhynchus agilis]
MENMELRCAFLLIVWNHVQIALLKTSNLYLPINIAIGHTLAASSLGNDLRMYGSRKPKNNRQLNRFDHNAMPNTINDESRDKEFPPFAAEAILRSQLLTGYYPDTRPVKNELTQTIVNISVNIRQVVKLVKIISVRPFFNLYHRMNKTKL